MAGGAGDIPPWGFVFPWPNTTVQSPIMSPVSLGGGDPQFLAWLDVMREMHIAKGRDYGSDTDPYANVRGSEEIGIPAWKGAWLRAKDKVRRIDNYCRKGELANEKVQDSFLDLAAYAIIALVLFEESIRDTSSTETR